MMESLYKMYGSLHSCMVCCVESWVNLSLYPLAWTAACSGVRYTDKFMAYLDPHILSAELDCLQMAQLV